MLEAFYQIQRQIEVLSERVNMQRGDRAMSGSLSAAAKELSPPPSPGSPVVVRGLETELERGGANGSKTDFRLGSIERVIPEEGKEVTDEKEEEQGEKVQKKVKLKSAQAKAKRGWTVLKAATATVRSHHEVRMGNSVLDKHVVSNEEADRFVEEAEFVNEQGESDEEFSRAAECFSRLVSRHPIGRCCVRLSELKPQLRQTVPTSDPGEVDSEKNESKQDQRPSYGRISFRVGFGSNRHPKAESESPAGFWQSMIYAISKKEYILSLDSRFRYIWDSVVMSTLTIYVAMEVPLLLCGMLKRSQEQKVVDMGVDIMFLLDVILNFFKSYEHRLSGQEVKDHQRIAWRYLTSWFLVDLISAIPVSYDARSNLTALKLFKLFRLRRFRLVLENVEGAFSDHISPYLVRLATQLFILALLYHFIACIYWVVAEESSDWEDCAWCPPEEFQEGHQFWRSYSLALHWAITTAMAAIVNPPETSEQINVTSAVIVLFVIVNASLIGSISKLMENLDAGRASRKAYFDDMLLNMRIRRVPRYMQKRILDYYEHIWSTGRSHQDGEMFKDLPRSLKVQLNVSLKRHLFEHVSIFDGCPAGAIVELSMALIPAILLPGDPVVYQGERGQEMYFITRGHLIAFCKRDRATNTSSKASTKAASLKNGCIPDGMQEVATLHAGSFFGEMSILDPTSIRTLSVRAATYSEVEVLRRENFISSLDRYPEWRKIVMRVYRSKMLQDARNQGEEDSPAGGSTFRLSIFSSTKKKPNVTVSLDRYDVTTSGGGGGGTADRKQRTNLQSEEVRSALTVRNIMGKRAIVSGRKQHGSWPVRSESWSDTSQSPKKSRDNRRASRIWR